MGPTIALIAPVRQRTMVRCTGAAKNASVAAMPDPDPRVLPKDVPKDGRGDGRCLLTCAAALPEAAEPPGEILLMPAGAVLFRAHDGRMPVINPDPDDVVGATMALRGAGGVDLVVDYEHQTQLAQWNGQPAPAAGWIERVFARDGAVWGAVRWTARAAEMIAAREYRYISPTFLHDSETRRVLVIVGAALVNDPALHMTALARAALARAGAEGGDTDKQGRSDMNLEELRAALGLGAEADEAAILTAAAAAHQASTTLGETLQALALDEGAGPEAILAAARAGPGGVVSDPDPNRFVPRAEFDRVTARLNTVESERGAERALAAVDAATQAGKIAPAQRDWALAYAGKDPAGFDAFVAAAAVILPQGEVMGEPAPLREAGGLTEAELAVCRATGISAEAFTRSANGRKEAAHG